MEKNFLGRVSHHRQLQRKESILKPKRELVHEYDHAIVPVGLNALVAPEGLRSEILGRKNRISSPTKSGTEDVESINC